MKIKEDQQVLDSIERLQDTQLFDIKQRIKEALDQKDLNSINQLHETNNNNNLTIKNLVLVSKSKILITI